MTACLAGHQLISLDFSLGREVQIYEVVSLRGCKIGDEALSLKTSPLVPLAYRA